MGRLTIGAPSALRTGFTAMKLHLVSLGCARNRVDSEVMLGCLIDAGHTITDVSADAEARSVGSFIFTSNVLVRVPVRFLITHSPYFILYDSPSTCNATQIDEDATFWGRELGSSSKSGSKSSKSSGSGHGSGSGKSSKGSKGGSSSAGSSGSSSSRSHCHIC